MNNNNIKAIANHIYWEMVKQVLNNNSGLYCNKKIAFLLQEMLPDHNLICFISDVIQTKYIGCSCDAGSKCDNVREQAYRVKDHLKDLINELKEAGK